MANNSGNDTRFQIGLEDSAAYGTAVTPTEQLEMLSESLGERHNFVESDALVGAVTTPYFNIIGRKVEGDLNLQVHPDNMGLILYATLGVEATPTDTVEAGVVYNHAFTPVKGGDSLPSLTAVVDKKSDVFVYSGLKINSLSLETDPGSLLTSTISFIGREEAKGGELATLDHSSLNPLDFNTMRVYVGDAGSEADVLVDYSTNFSFTYNNNLENDLYVADGTQYMYEIDYQKRDITLDIEALYNSDSNTLREDFFKTGYKMSIKVEFDSRQIIDGSVSDPKNTYKIVLDIRNFVVTEAPNDISGPERLRIPISGRALEVGSDPAITVILQDGQSSKHSA